MHVTVACSEWRNASCLLCMSLAETLHEWEACGGKPSFRHTIVVEGFEALVVVPPFMVWMNTRSYSNELFSSCTRVSGFRSSI